MGYGKMGKVIERIARERGHEVVLRADSEHPPERSDLEKADVAIDFSIPKAAPGNIRACFAVRVPIVVGTTGWEEEREALIDTCREKGGTLFYAPNFSLGVNIFFALNERLGELMNAAADYELSVDETHHTEKLDAPSGTAKKVADSLVGRVERKSRWAMEGNGKDAIVVRSHREPEVPGIHVVHCDSAVDEITLKHSAKSRDGFAKGAVVAAEWVRDKKGVFTMNDLLGL